MPIQRGGGLKSPFKMSPHDFQCDPNAATKPTLNAGYWFGSSGKIWGSIPLGTGNIVTQVRAAVNGAANAMTLTTRDSDGSFTAIPPQIGTVNSVAPTGDQFLTLGNIIPFVPNHLYVAEIVFAGGGFMGLEVYWR